MHRSSAALLLIAALGTAGGVALARDHDDDQTRLAKALAGYTPGAPTSCIDPASPTLSSTVYGKTIIYRDGPGRLWRNDTTGGCEGAANGDILVQVEHEGRPCSGDIIRTVDQVARFPTGSCSLGQFVPYKRIR